MKNLELYVHIPFCVKKCAYCDFLSFAADEKTQLHYADALIKEIIFYGSVMKAYTVSTIFIGGGTPSWLKEEKMLEILNAVYQNFQVLPDAEISMECNPGTVTPAKLAAYRKAGINRLSIGLQSADNEELKILGRIHTFEQFLKTYEMARNVGFDNINVDVISGIPYQTAEKFLRTLQKVIQLKPNHISAYSLIVEPGTPFYAAYKGDVDRQENGMQTEILPTEDEVYRMTKLTRKILAEAGYEQYEISNFAQPGFACKHNIGYWTRENYLGLGLGAASLIEHVRYSNLTDLHEYMKNAENIQWISWEQNCGLQGVTLKQDENIQKVSVEENCDLQGVMLKQGENIQKIFQQQNNMTAPTAVNLHASVEPLSRKAQMEEFMFLGLRMKQGVTREKFQKTFGVSIDGVYKAAMEHLKAEGLLETKEGKIVLTEQGEDVSNYALAQFLLS